MSSGEQRGARTLGDASACPLLQYPSENSHVARERCQPARGVYAEPRAGFGRLQTKPQSEQRTYRKKSVRTTTRVLAEAHAPQGGGSSRFLRRSVASGAASGLVGFGTDTGSLIAGAGVVR